MEARGFYGILIAATTIGVALNFTEIDPVKALDLERGDQRRDLGAHHGGDDADGGAPGDHGALHREAAPQESRLARRPV